MYLSFNYLRLFLKFNYVINLLEIAIIIGIVLFNTNKDIYYLDYNK